MTACPVCETYSPDINREIDRAGARSAHALDLIRAKEADGVAVTEPIGTVVSPRVLRLAAATAFEETS